MHDGILHAAWMVEKQLVLLYIHVAVENHRGDSEFFHCLEHRWITLVAWRDDHAIHTAALEHREDFEFPLRIVQAVCQQHHVPGMAQLGLEDAIELRVQRV
ncbi:hypothetical protein D3C72_1401170 [compost metagenome]